jgi:hypothetical protein
VTTSNVTPVGYTIGVKAVADTKEADPLTQKMAESRRKTCTYRLSSFTALIETFSVRLESRLRWVKGISIGTDRR